MVFRGFSVVHMVIIHMIKVNQYTIMNDELSRTEKSIYKSIE